MRPVAAGRPGTQVIPDGWEAAHGPAVVGTMTATVSLRKPGGTTEWSEADQATVLVPFEPYATDVPARIQALISQERTADAAGETVHVRGYLVTLPRDVAGVLPDDLATITATNDPDLDGRELLVTDVLRGSLRFERDLFCTLDN